MERGQDSVEQRFFDDLRKLRQMAGRPSYSILERLSEHRLRRATMSDILNANRVKLPEWRFVQEFVTACRAAAEENRLNPDTLGTVADWNRHWQDAANGVIGAGFPGRRTDPLGAEPSRAGASDGSGPASGQALTPSPETATPSNPVFWGPIPPRLPDFTGRETWFTALREAFAQRDRVGPAAVQGPPGAGKTQLAAEYIYRYASAYDLVWWVSNDAARAVSDFFPQTKPFAHWLLVLDGEDDPDTLMSLIPPFSGDMLVTTRSTRWDAFGDLVELDVFDRAESVEFLRHRQPGISDVTAHHLADSTGDLPLLLAHAADTRLPASLYLERLRDDPLSLLTGRPMDYHSDVRQVWQDAIIRLRRETPHAYTLLCCLSAFGTGPVPRGTLERGGFLESVSAYNLLRDPNQLAGAIRILRYAGLVRAGPDTRSLALHPVTQYIARELAADSRFRHDAHLLLAAADPRTPGDPTSWQRYAELHVHSTASETAACPHPMVREFVVNLVRYLTAAGDPYSAAALADQAIAAQEPDPAGQDATEAATSATPLLLLVAKAEALFAQGTPDDWTEAFRLREEALAGLRAAPDRWAAEITSIEGTAGAQHRLSGHFAEALAADRVTKERLTAMYGPGDPRTFAVASGVITDLLLGGRVTEAPAAAEELHRNCLEFYSEENHPAVLAARNLIGRCQWAAGSLHEGTETLAEVHHDYAADSLLGKNHPWRLIHETDYVIVRRDLEPGADDLRGLADEAYRLRRRCWQSLGAGHPQTLAVTVVLGSVLRRINGREGETVNLLEDAERRYRAVLPDHPYTHACGAYLEAVKSSPDTLVNGDFTPLPL